MGLQIPSGLVCSECGTETIHVMPEEETWETVHPPVKCPACGHDDVLTIDAEDAGERHFYGNIMAKLVQEKRDNHNADHLDDLHADEPMPLYCHHCRDAA